MDTLREALRSAAIEQMDTDGAHDLAHLDRVWANVRHIAEGEKQGNMRVLVAATYLHDLVNLPKNSPDRKRASTMAAEAAVPILEKIGYTATEITQTQHAIAAHSFSANIAVETTEAAILRDADRLDAIGAIGIARMFCITGQLDTPLYDITDPFAADRPLDDKKFAMDHWRVKLLGLGGGFITTTAHAEAQKRLGLMYDFLDQLSGELGTTLPAYWKR